MSQDHSYAHANKQYTRHTEWIYTKTAVTLRALTAYLNNVHIIQYTSYIVENTSRFRGENQLVNTVTGNIDIFSENH